MINVNNPTGITPALLDSLAGADAAKATSPGYTALDPAQFIDKGGAVDKLAALGLPPPASGAFAGAADALNKLMTNAATDMYAVMALLQKISQEQRNAARADRAASLDAQTQSLLAAADKIKEAAEERFKGALAQGISQIVGGALQAGVGAGGVAAMGASARMTTTSSPLTAQQTVTQARLDGFANNSSGIGQGLSGMAGGVGGIVQAAYDRKAGEADAARAQLEAQAKVAESGAQHATDVMQQMMDVIRDIRDKLGAIEQSRGETNRGIARNL
ncbi:type III secretion system translocon subunit SctB [Achromobacter xylosoxidans]|uniref:type III secretion system translocon subunit SctB n=1 Tax=Alcaligenes xylosoxydans xylosoxydans TaxID=85698 RepID=UPI001F1486EA|nr:type III secretion system translocon subunit SctB [Achromobacter xylosoxidans]